MVTAPELVANCWKDTETASIGGMNKAAMAKNT